MIYQPPAIYPERTQQTAGKIISEDLNVNVEKSICHFSSWKLYKI